MIKVVIFDHGGVIADPGGLRFLSKEYSKILGIPEEKIHKSFLNQWFKWRIDKINKEQAFKNFLSDLNIKIDIKKLKKIMFNQSHEKKEVIKIIKELRKKKIKIGILTNHVREWFENEKKRYKLNKLADLIITSYETKLVKPQPGIYKIILKKFKVKPNECIFIDDEIKNVGEANKLHMKGIRFISEKKLKQDLMELGVL